MRKYLIISLLASYSIVFAGESEDFKAVDNLYKERNFKAALVESEKFLQKYPESKHQKSMRDTYTNFPAQQNKWQPLIRPLPQKKTNICIVKNFHFYQKAI